MEDIKRKYGLTNAEIAQGIDDLSDTDFYEVMTELTKLHSIDVKTESFGNWIDQVLCEIESNEEERNNNIVQCLNCNHEFILTETLQDTLGSHTICPECGSSFDIKQQ